MQRKPINIFWLSIGQEIMEDGNEEAVNGLMDLQIMQQFFAGFGCGLILFVFAVCVHEGKGENTQGCRFVFRQIEPKIGVCK